MSVLLDKGMKYIQYKYPVMHMALTEHRTHLDKRISFKNRPYQVGIFKDKSLNKVYMKSTQNGISEYVIIFSMHDCMEGRNILYTFPTETLKNRFVSARFDKTVENTPYYKQNRKDLNSTSIKGFKKGIINFVNSNSPANFTEFVAHTVVVEEKDQCNQINLNMTDERQSGVEEHKIKIEISNPTINEYGIHNSFLDSDQKWWHIKCGCGKYIKPDFFTHVVEKIDQEDYVLRDKEYEWDMERDVYLICEHCGRPVNRYSSGEWVSENQSKISGWQISKLYSGTDTISKMVKRFQKGLVNDNALQRFYNGDLGIPYTGKGAKLIDEQLDRCKREYNEQDGSKSPCVVGVDVGKVLSVLVADIVRENGINKLRIIRVDEVKNKEDLINLYNYYNIKCFCIDGEPEIRMVKSLKSMKPNIWASDYKHTQSLKDSIDNKARIINVDRTSIMDTVKEAVLLENVLFPKNAKSITNLYDQLKAPTRIWVDRESHPQGGYYKYVEGTKADHYYHSLVNLLLAQKILLMMR
jgi:hypothetical protein